MKNDKLGRVFKKNTREILVLAAIVLLFIIFIIIVPNFFSMANIIAIVDMATIYGVMAVGMCFAIISGGIDLSMGAAMAIEGVFVAVIMNKGVPVIPAILITVVMAVIMGWFNGFLVTRLKLQPFIATLATQNIFRGAAYLVTGGIPITGLPDKFRTIFYGMLPGGFRSACLIFIVLCIIMSIVLRHTKLGNYIYAVGSNPEASRLSGINVLRTKTICYMLAGFCSAIAAFILTAKVGAAEGTAALTYEQQGISGAAIGGISMAGGRGTILGAFLGSILLNLLRHGLIAAGLNAYWQYVVIGIVMIVAVSTDLIKTKDKSSK